MKICPKCGIEKKITDFYKAKGHKAGSYCKPCSRTVNEEWVKNNPERKRANRRKSYRHTAASIKERNLKKTYNITIDEIKTKLGQQKGCAICHRGSPTGKGWCVDHDHFCCAGKKSCGVCVRGVLCSKCNSGIAMFDDDLSKLASAIEYLQKDRVVEL